MRLQSLLVISLHLSCLRKALLVRFSVVVLFCSVSFQSLELRHLVIHGSCNFRQTNFEDVSRIFKGKLQFSRTTIYSINRQSLTSFWTPYLLNHSMESFTIFTSSAMVDHIILCYFTQQHFAKWLGMTCNCIWGTEIAFEIKKKKTEIKYCLCTKCFTLPVSFTGSYTEDETNFPRQNNNVPDWFPFSSLTLSALEHICNRLSVTRRQVATRRGDRSLRVYRSGE